MIHKEGTATIIIFFLLLSAINAPFWIFLSDYPVIYLPLLFISLVFYGFILSFFRNPKRPVDHVDNNNILCPADGRIVVIEETDEPEYFKDRRMQVSVFMSPFNVHVNRYPLSGLISYFRYHEGLYLLAYHPKSSTLNERTSTVIRKDDGTEILVRQVAGRIARRVVPYAKEGMNVTQGGPLGFIKFGSRIDLYLPLDIKIDVELEQVVKGNRTVLARFK